MRFINGYIIALIATPSPAMETRNVVTFSKKAVSFVVVCFASSFCMMFNLKI